MCTRVQQDCSEEQCSKQPPVFCHCMTWSETVLFCCGRSSAPEITWRKYCCCGRMLDARSCAQTARSILLTIKHHAVLSVKRCVTLLYRMPYYQPRGKPLLPLVMSGSCWSDLFKGQGTLRSKSLQTSWAMQCTSLRETAAFRGAIKR